MASEVAWYRSGECRAGKLLVNKSRMSRMRQVSTRAGGAKGLREEYDPRAKGENRDDEGKGEGGKPMGDGCEMEEG